MTDAFSQAWSLLKSRTYRNYPPSIAPTESRAGKQTQYSPISTGNTIPLVGGMDNAQNDNSSMGGSPISSSTRRAREKSNMRQMMRNEQMSESEGE